LPFFFGLPPAPAYNVPAALQAQPLRAAIPSAPDSELHMSAARTRDRFVGPAAVLALTGALLAPRPVPAAPTEPKPPEERRVEVGQSLSPAGTLFRRQATQKAWRTVRRQQPIHSGDLLLALPGAVAAVESGNGAVRAYLWGNTPDLSRSAVLESAVVLHATPGVDLDFTLDRGRVVVSSTKDKEPARVRVRVRDTVWELTLPDKGDEAALELYGRWPRGVPFSADPKSPERPTADLVFLTLSGSTEVKAGPARYTMHAPPRDGYFHWDSVDGQDPGPQALKKPPAWATPAAAQTTEFRRVRQVLGGLAEQVRDKPLTVALTSLLDGANDASDKAQAAVTRQFVVFSWAACDDLGQLVRALGDPKRPEMRETAVDALRHWIGRAPGQDLELDNFLIKEEKFPPTQAEIVMQLLHSPFEADRPEIYQTLIEYLRSDKVAIRQLAKWHLERLAPAGRAIAFDPAGSEDERGRAYQKWKELIPDGQLPPKRKPGDR
jgi:hypothetical protein